MPEGEGHYVGEILGSPADAQFLKDLGVVIMEVVDPEDQDFAMFHCVMSPEALAKLNLYRWKFQWKLDLEVYND